MNRAPSSARPWEPPTPSLSTPDRRGWACDQATCHLRALCADRAQDLPDDLRSYLASPVEDAENGYWIIEGFAARANNVQHYTIDGQRVAAFRPEEEVSHPDALASYLHKPVLHLHPEQRGASQALLDPALADRLSPGGVVAGVEYIPEIERVKVTMHVWGATCLDGFLGKDRTGGGRFVELSPGYWRDLVPEPGTAPDGTPYTHTFRNIRINHLAQVDYARGGRTTRVATDAGESSMKFIVKMLDGRWVVCDLEGNIVDGGGDFASEEEATAFLRNMSTEDMGSGSGNPEEENTDGGSGTPAATPPTTSTDAAAGARFKHVTLTDGRTIRVNAEDAPLLMDALKLDQAQRAATDAATARAEAEGAKAEATSLRKKLRETSTDRDTWKARAEGRQAELDKLRKRDEERELARLKTEARTLLTEEQGASVDAQPDAQGVKRLVIGSVGQFKDLNLTDQPRAAVDAYYESARRIIETDRGHLAGNGGTGAATDSEGGNGGGEGGTRGASNDRLKKLEQEALDRRAQWIGRQRNLGTAQAAQA